MAVLPGTPKNPAANSRETEPAKEFQSPGDAGVIGQKVPAAEDGVPIVVAAANQGQLHGSGVGQVAGNIEEVLEQPKAARSNAEWFTFAPKADEQDAGKNELADGAAVRFEASAEEAHNGMAGFVEEEVGVVEQKDEPGFGTDRKSTRLNSSHRL